MTDNKKWNPRFVLYAKANGRTPESQAEHDDQQPAKMLGFINWMRDRWSEWRTANRRGPYDPLFAEDHASFDRWLAEVVTPAQEPQR